MPNSYGMCIRSRILVKEGVGELGLLRHPPLPWVFLNSVFGISFDWAVFFEQTSGGRGPTFIVIPQLQPLTGVHLCLNTHCTFSSRAKLRQNEQSSGGVEARQYRRQDCRGLTTTTTSLTILSMAPPHPLLLLTSMLPWPVPRFLFHRRWCGSTSIHSLQCGWGVRPPTSFTADAVAVDSVGTPFSLYPHFTVVNAAPGPRNL